MLGVGSTSPRSDVTAETTPETSGVSRETDAVSEASTLSSGDSVGRVSSIPEINEVRSAPFDSSSGSSVDVFGMDRLFDGRFVGRPDGACVGTTDVGLPGRVGLATGRRVDDPAGMIRVEVSLLGRDTVICVGPVTSVEDGKSAGKPDGTPVGGTEEGSMGSVELATGRRVDDPAGMVIVDVWPLGRETGTSVGPVTSVEDGTIVGIATGRVVDEPAGIVNVDISPLGRDTVTCVGPVTTVEVGTVGMVTGSVGLTTGSVADEPAGIVKVEI